MGALQIFGKVMRPPLALRGHGFWYITEIELEI